MALVVGENSYGSQAEADAYFSDSLRAATWAAFSTTLRDQGLVEATRVIERQPLKGEKEVPTQDLHFPATGLIDRCGKAVTPAESLEIAKEAEFEYAIVLIQDASVLDSTDATGNNIKVLKASSAGIEYFRPSSGTRFPVIVNDLIGTFLKSGSTAGKIITPFVSGDDEQSSFCDPDAYGYTNGGL